MAVATHLGIDVTKYDEHIRTFVPYYEEMLETCAAIVEHATASGRAPTMVELGVGSGALAARCLARRPARRLIGIHGDASMLAMAATRLGSLASGADVFELIEGDFTRVALPRCDVVMASLALHHVATRRRKQTLYERIASALAPGGVLVSADCMPPSEPALADRGMESWRAHVRGSYSARQATGYFRAWAGEDHYQTLDVEQSLLSAAGLVPDVVWRRGVFAVLVGTRPRRRGQARESSASQRA